MRSRKLVVAIVAASVTLVVSALAALPSASADSCAVTVTLAGGRTETFTVNVPAGGQVSTASLPVSGPVLGVSESCTSTSTSTTQSTTTPASPGTNSQPTSSGSGGSNQSSGGQQKQSGGKNGGGNSTQINNGFNGPPAPAAGPKAAPPPPPLALPPAARPAPPSLLRTTTGVPTPANPTFSLALPGAAPIGLPSFFIDSFRVPGFLMPIYLAAGIEYDVPWQTLAAINEIETDYGRNLSVSSAGAIGWMQFLPPTWKQYAVDANGDGLADPYNPVDAIFTAARFLHAAGASKDLHKAILAYNPAEWYAQSVLLRAKLLGGMPDQMIGSLTTLVQEHFPVAAKSKYADDPVEKSATRRVKSSGNGAIPASSQPKSVSIFAKKNSPVIAVNDGKIVKVGQSPKLGRYVQLQDEAGNLFTYAQLGAIAKDYLSPNPVKATAAGVVRALSAPAPAPKSPSGSATAGTQQPGAAATKPAAQPKNAPLSLPVAPAQNAPVADSFTPMVKERLFAYPHRANSYAAGGALQIKNTTAQITNFQNYFSGVLHLDRKQSSVKPLTAGAQVPAGTIIARIGPDSGRTASHIQFMIRPAGNKAPDVDPKPILDDWKLLEATALYRATGLDPFYGVHAKNPTIGQILLMSKTQLQNRLLADPHVQIYACGRQDIQNGRVDRRIMTAVAFLSASGFKPYVSGLLCGQKADKNPTTGLAVSSGSSVEISKINGIPILGHTGKGSIADLATQRLLTLQGPYKPDQIIGTMSYKGHANTIALSDHKDRIQVTFTPYYGENKKLSKQVTTLLQPNEWIQLINRIGQIPEPVVPVAPSKYAVRAGNH